MLWRMFVFSSHFKSLVFLLMTGKLPWSSKIQCFECIFSIFILLKKTQLFLSCTKSVPTQLCLPSASNMFCLYIFVTKLSPWETVTGLLEKRSTRVNILDRNDVLNYSVWFPMCKVLYNKYNLIIE